jgi:hypothetical protein
VVVACIYLGGTLNFDSSLCTRNFHTEAKDFVAVDEADPLYLELLGLEDKDIRNTSLLNRI